MQYDIMILFRSSILIECKGDDGITTKQYPHFNELTEEFVCDKVLENGFIATETPPIAVVISELSQ